MNLQFSSQLTSIKANPDRTLAIKLETQELTNEEMAQIFGYMNKQVWTAIAETAITKEDLNIPEALAEFKGDKTPSQRLRGILYRYWEKHRKKVMDWELFYRQEIDKICEYLKDKLD